jgi:hypothetical protein
MEPVVETWATMTQSLPEFVEVFHAAFRGVQQLALETTPAENADVGMLVIELMMGSYAERARLGWKSSPSQGAPLPDP